MELTTENIWAQYNKGLRGFIRSKIKDAETANDILQDVFLKAHLNLVKLKDKNKVQQWLYQIARNAMNDHFRTQKHSTDSELPDVKDENFMNPNAKFAACMNSFVKVLPEKYKEAITKVEFEGMDQTEFAKQLQISYSGAKSRVQRAKELLRGYFLQCCNVSTDKYGNIIDLKGKTNCGVCEI